MARAVPLLAQSVMATPRPVLDLKAFVPAEDFAVASQFYPIGFKRAWAAQSSPPSKSVPPASLLQNYFVEQLAGLATLQA